MLELKYVLSKNVWWFWWGTGVRFIYTGTIEMTIDIAQDLLRDADQYILEGLKHLCEYSIVQVFFYFIAVFPFCYYIGQPQYWDLCFLFRALLWRNSQVYMILLIHIMQLLWVICVLCTFRSTMNRCLTCMGKEKFYIAEQLQWAKNLFSIYLNFYNQFSVQLPFPCRTVTTRDTWLLV